MNASSRVLKEDLFGSVSRREGPGIAAAAVLVACRSPRFDPEDPAVVATIDSIVQSMMEGAANVVADRVLAPAGDDLTFITGEVMLSGLEPIRACGSARPTLD